MQKNPKNFSEFTFDNSFYKGDLVFFTSIQIQQASKNWTQNFSSKNFSKFSRLLLRKKFFIRFKLRKNISSSHYKKLYWVINI